MPRLIGKRSNANPVIALVFMFAIGTGVSLEYFGYMNLLPGFGKLASVVVLGRFV